MSPQVLFSQQEQSLNEKILKLETDALERWNNGDPMGYIELYADDITYFDPFAEMHIDSKKELAKLYESIKGKIHVEKYKILNPVVQVYGEVVILIYNLESYSDNKLSKWNCSEVFRKEPDGSWKIFHSHWSLTKPDLK